MQTAVLGAHVLNDSQEDDNFLLAHTNCTPLA